MCIRDRCYTPQNYFKNRQVSLPDPVLYTCIIRFNKIKFYFIEAIFKLVSEIWMDLVGHKTWLVAVCLCSTKKLNNTVIKIQFDKQISKYAMVYCIWICTGLYLYPKKVFVYFFICVHYCICVVCYFNTTIIRETHFFLLLDQFIEVSRQYWQYRQQCQ